MAASSRLSAADVKVLTEASLILSIHLELPSAVERECAKPFELLRLLSSCRYRNAESIGN